MSRRGIKKVFRSKRMKAAQKLPPNNIIEKSRFYANSNVAYPSDMKNQNQLYSSSLRCQKIILAHKLIVA